MKRIIPQIEPLFDKEEEKELMATIRSSWIAEARKTKRFEDMVASFLNVKYTHAVPNGTLAITVACLAAGLRTGDEAIIPDLTMAGTLTGVLLIGLKPLTVDIKESDLTIDPIDLEKKITKKTKAIIPVHINGRPAEMGKIKDIAQKYSLLVIEDAAQAFGSRLGKRFLGTIGDIGCFSFSIPKIVTTGQGGMVVTNNKRLSERILELKDQGRRIKGVDVHDSIGFNFRFTDLQAAIGVAQMKKVNRRLKKKREIYHLYEKLLKGIEGIEMLPTNLEETAPWFIDVYVEKRVKLIKYLEAKRIKTRLIYPPLHSQKAYKDILPKGSFPVTNRLAKKGLWLPSSVSLREDEIRKVSRAISDFFQNG